MLQFLRRLFGKKSKRKSIAQNSDARYVTNKNYIKLQIAQHHEEPIEYSGPSIATENKATSNNSTKILTSTAKVESTYDECAEDFYADIDTQVETTRPKPTAKIYYTPELFCPQTYDHLTGFMDAKRNKDEYDVLIRDPCYPELLKKSKSDLDLRENNNYLTISDTEAKDINSTSTTTSENNKTFTKRIDRRPIKFDPLNRNAVTKSLTMCGPRNVTRTRRSQYIRTRAGQPILPLEPRMKRITIAESYIRAANSSSNKVNRTESQVSRGHVDALRAQFDEKSSTSKVAAIPQRQVTRAPLSLAVKSSRNSAETKCELAESHLFNAMKSKIDSKGRVDTECHI